MVITALTPALQSDLLLFVKVYEKLFNSLLQHFIVNYIAYLYTVHCERFELRSYFKSRLSLIVWVSVVLNRTVVVVDSD